MGTSGTVGKSSSSGTVLEKQIEQKGEGNPELMVRTKRKQAQL